MFNLGSSHTMMSSFCYCIDRDSCIAAWPISPNKSAGWTSGSVIVFLFVCVWKKIPKNWRRSDAGNETVRKVPALVTYINFWSANRPCTPCHGLDRSIGNQPVGYVTQVIPLLPASWPLWESEWACQISQQTEANWNHTKHWHTHRGRQKVLMATAWH